MLAALLASSFGVAAERPSASNGLIVFSSDRAENSYRQLYAVDVASPVRTRRLSRLGRSSCCAAWAPDGRRLAFVRCGPEGCHVVVTDPAARPLQTAGVFADARDVTWSRAGRLAFAAAGAVWVLDGARATRLGAGRAPAWSPDGRTLAAVDGNDLILLTNGGRRIVRGGVHPRSLPGWSPSGAELTFGVGVGATEEVRAVTRDGLRERALAAGRHAFWSPDGESLAVVRYGTCRHGDLFLASADGRVQRRLSRSCSPRLDELVAAWSPDGRRVAFVEAQDGRQPLVVEELERDARRTIATGPRGTAVALAEQAWSPSGGTLLFSSVRLSGNDYDLYVANERGRRIRGLTRTPANERAAVWSPDGSQLAFVRSARGKQAAIVRMPLGRAASLVLRGCGCSWLSWSPDGGRLAFARRGWTYTVRAEGGRPRRVARGRQPSWSPLDDRIALLLRGNLYVVDARGGGRVLVADRRALERALRRTGLRPVATAAPTWTRDGGQIHLVVRARDEAKNAITTGVVVRARPGARVRLARLATRFRWAPDGRRAVTTVFLGEPRHPKGGSHEVAVLDADGRRVALLRHPAREVDPDWQPICSVRGSARDDRLAGSEGNDLVCGRAGNDTLRGGAGRDRLFGGPGRDRVFARDGTHDVVGCGPGRDRVVADDSDLVGPDCERRARSQPRRPPERERLPADA